MIQKSSLVYVGAAVLLAILMLEACVHEPFIKRVKGECDPDTVYFQRDIQPILNTYCATGCHDEATAQKGVVLTSYERLMATTETEAGDPEESEIYELITDTDPEDRMPYGQAPLSPENIALIRKWIEQGSLNNTCDFDTVSNDCAGTGISYGDDVVPILQGNGCVGCHSGGSVILNNYDGVMAVVTSGQLMGAITHDSSYQAMPQGGSKLDSCTIQTIETWIAEGSLNN
ncbi:MAG: c-type cytochrome domain-containing protein [Cryomorphaceae bacterium]